MIIALERGSVKKYQIFILVRLKLFFFDILRETLSILFEDNIQRCHIIEVSRDSVMTVKRSSHFGTNLKIKYFDFFVLLFFTLHFLDQCGTVLVKNKPKSKLSTKRLSIGQIVV
jgi:hypothetical protein